MASVEDIRNRKRIRSEIAKKSLDITAMDLQVIHGVVYIRGVVRSIKGLSGDPRKALEDVGRHVRQLGLAKDVVIDCTFRN